MKARWAIALVVLGLAAVQIRPASSQGAPFRFLPPPSTEALDRFTILWSDDPESDPAVSPTSITWFYSASRDGTDRRRIATSFHDDFSRGYLRRWKPTGPFAFDWTVARDGEGRTKLSYLKGGRQSGPIVFREALEFRNTVISARVRPTGIKNEFAIGFRTQPTDEGYEVRNRGLEVEVLEQGKSIASRPLGDASFPGRWYWYEVSCRNQGGKGVEIRVRIYDERHSRVIAKIGGINSKPATRELMKGGSMAFWGPVDIAEVYVDRWESRWVDGRDNRLDWDTSAVPAGKYYLIAELDDGERRPVRYVSPYQVDVRKDQMDVAQ